jgi:hypothetical protein
MRCESLEPPTSQVGYERPKGDLSALSPFDPQLRTFVGPARSSHCVRALQQARCIGWLFNYLVGADKQPWRQGEAERPRGLEVD